MFSIRTGYRYGLSSLRNALVGNQKAASRYFPTRRNARSRFGCGRRRRDGQQLLLGWGVLFSGFWAGCAPRSSWKMEAGSRELPAPTESFAESSAESSAESLSNASESPQSPFFCVVLLHGFFNRPLELKSVEQRLLCAFGKGVLIVQPETRAGRKSFTKTLERQAGDVFKELKEALKQANQSANDFPLFLVGYSHGGVVACALGQQYRDQLNIRGIATLNAPLAGVELLERTPAEVREFAAQAAKGWEVLSEKSKMCSARSLETMQNTMQRQARAAILFRRLVDVLPVRLTNLLAGGGKSLLPNAEPLRNVRKFLREEDHAIPCLLIGSCQENFGELFGVTGAAYAPRMHELKAAYAKLVTGDPDGRHDTLLSINTQLCRGPSLELLPMEPYGSQTVEMPERPHVDALVCNNATHAQNLIALDPDLFVTNEAIENLPNAPSVLNGLVDFIRENTKNLLN